ncbi:MAG: hypothetical protein FJ039_06460 [Chloroflexi bacterium]|nr:hypothetical protein [Chloroflexota bacterium]
MGKHRIFKHRHRHDGDDGCHDASGFDCREVHKHASDMVDGDMPKPMAERIRQHLGFCPPCQALLNSVAKTVGLVKSVPKAKCPESLKASILEKTKTAK